MIFFFFRLLVNSVIEIIGSVFWYNMEYCYNILIKWVCGNLDLNKGWIIEVLNWVLLS